MGNSYNDGYFRHKQTHNIGTLHLTYNVGCDTHIFDPARSLGILTRCAQAISTPAKASSAERLESNMAPEQDDRL